MRALVATLRDAASAFQTEKYSSPLHVGFFDARCVRNRQLNFQHAMSISCSMSSTDTQRSEKPTKEGYEMSVSTKPSATKSYQS